MGRNLSGGGAALTTGEVFDPSGIVARDGPRVILPSSFRAFLKIIPRCGALEFAFSKLQGLECFGRIEFVQSARQ